MLIISGSAADILRIVIPLVNMRLDLSRHDLSNKHRLLLFFFSEVQEVPEEMTKTTRLNTLHGTGY